MRCAARAPAATGCVAVLPACLGDPWVLVLRRMRADESNAETPLKLDSLTTNISIAALVVIAACTKQEDKEPAATSASSRTAGATHESGKMPDDNPQSTDTAAGPAISPAPAKPAVPALPQVTRWELDPENSSVTFVCKHSMATNVRGMFRQPSGTVVLDEATPANSRVSATIEVNSITTGVDERDTDLKSPEFFDAPTYPVITFVSTKFTKSSDSQYTVAGNLTMHGVTLPVTLAVTASPPFPHFGTIRRGIEATTSVNRQDFGVGVAAWNVPDDETGGLIVGNTVNITIDAELVLKPEPGEGN